MRDEIQSPRLVRAYVQVFQYPCYSPMKFRSLVVSACTAAVLLSVLPSASAVRATGDGDTSDTTMSKPGNADAGTSVVWLVLDEAPLYALLKTDGSINEKRFPGFAELARHSTWYRNTLATAQRTTEAVPALLDGKWPTLRNYPVYRDHPVNLFTVARNHKKLDVFQTITSLCPKGLCPNRIPVNQRHVRNQVQQFRNLIVRASTSTTATVHFSHLLLPHRPWRLSTESRVGKDLESDPRPGDILDRRRDSYQALLRQFVATDALVLELISELKKSANWERTMLVVTTDHGITFVPGESYRDEVNPKNPGTLEDIYRIPLFIKYPNQQSSAVNNCPVSSIDILPTVLSAAQIPHRERFDGKDLTATCPRRTSRRVQWPYTGTDMTTNFSAILKRVRYYNTWVSANGDVDDIHRVGRSGQLIGTRTPDTFKRSTKVKWLNIDRTSFQNIGSSSLSYVPSRVSGLVTTSTAFCKRCEGVLVVDNVVVASIPELAGIQPSSTPQYITTSLLTSGITSSSGPAELWIVDWTRSTPVFSRVGPSR